jgi:hypothetical protein
MALAKNTKRYQHSDTHEIKYFKDPPKDSRWIKIGTPGSKKWRWINNGTVEEYISPNDPIPSGFTLGRLRN